MGGDAAVTFLGPDGIAERMARLDARMGFPAGRTPAPPPPTEVSFGGALDDAMGDFPIDPTLGAENPLSGPIGKGGDLRAMADAAARRHGVDPALFNALVTQESGWNPSAESRVGAKGLCQLMDGTAREMAVADPYDPAQSLDGGARYLRRMLDVNGGDPARALASYNAGFGRVNGRAPGEWPAETRSYVARILAHADRGRV